MNDRVPSSDRLEPAPTRIDGIVAAVLSQRVGYDPPAEPGASTMASPTSVTEYLELERRSEFRHEFIDGRIIPRQGASRDHMRIVVNLSRRLNEQFRNGRFEVFATAMRICVGHEIAYLYPDVVVTGDNPQFIVDEPVTLSNPIAVHRSSVVVHRTQRSWPEVRAVSTDSVPPRVHPDQSGSSAYRAVHQARRRVGLERL